MRNNKRAAVFGMSKAYYENSRMIARARRLVSGRHVIVLQGKRTIGDWAYSQTNGKVGVIIDDHPYMWDVVARFKNDSKRGYIDFGFWSHDVQVVK